MNDKARTLYERLGGYDAISAVAIDFLAPAKIGDVLTAEARERWLGGRTGLYDLSVTRADGTVIAHARGRSHRLRAAPPQTT